jgi:gamma-butyrobetaine dioxygenase
MRHPGGRDIVAVVEELFAQSGASMYFGEAVTQQAHALQSAWLASCEGAAATLVVAALLHDVGHFLHGHDEDIAGSGVDARHEEDGCAWLAQYFGPEVTEPTRLHVDAKRYLCGHDPEYVAALSPASRQSLALQGGPFGPRQLREFAERPFARDAIRLRRWDDRAKDPSLSVPGIEQYAAALLAAASGHVGPFR